MSRRDIKPNRARKIKARIARELDRLFPTREQVQLIEILGGATLTLGMFRKHGRQLTIVLNRGRLLRSERFRRRVINDMGVLANDVQWAIEIKGQEYERDVVAAYERDQELRSQGWRLMSIKATDLWLRPNQVRSTIKQFLV